MITPPTIIMPKADFSSARFMPVGKRISTLGKDFGVYDFLLVAPQARFDCDGLYVFDEGGSLVVRRASWTCRGRYPNRELELSVNQPGYGRFEVTEEQFNSNLAGQVAGHLSMSCPHLIPGLLETYP